MKRKAPLIITMDDIMKAGHCPSGTKKWFLAHELDFRDFMRAGIPAETLLAANDAIANQVVERTIARRGNG